MSAKRFLCCHTGPNPIPGFYSSEAINKNHMYLTARQNAISSHSLEEILHGLLRRGLYTTVMRLNIAGLTEPCRTLS